MPKRTIENLRLNPDAAIKGKTWELLPKGFRDQPNGSTYPLPSERHEIQRIAAIYVPPFANDTGCTYIRRCIQEFKSRQARQNSAVFDIGRREFKIKSLQNKFTQTCNNGKKEILSAIEEVRQEAVHAIASLNDLFALGRKGIEGQMRAHLENEDWQGERIDASAFRQCFRMVTMAVKGLGLPSEQRSKASEAVIEELAASLRSTQEALAMSSPVDSETKH